MSLYAYPTQKAFLVHLLILLFSFFFYLPSLSYSFISDDFFYISFSTFSQVLSFQKGLYHYNPLFWGTLFVLKHIFGITPFPFHFVTIFMHVINTFLVYFLARAFAFRIKQGLLVSLLFSVFFSHYEVVYWITGLSTSLMLFFYLIGILFLISYVQTQKISFFLLYLLAIIASFLAHEYAISLVPLGLIYLFLTKPKKIRSILFLFIPLLLFIGILTLAKVFLGDSSLIVTSLSPGRIIISFIKSFLYIFTANPYLIDHVPHIFLLFVFLFLILLFVIGSFYSHRRMFFLLWIIITMLIFSFTSLPQARYFYLSSLPMLFLLIDLFSSQKRFFFLFSFCILISSLFFLAEQNRYWQESSRITNETLAIFDSYSLQLKEAERIYIFNVPDSSNAGVWKAYIFRNGLTDWLSTRYGIEKIRVFLLPDRGELKNILKGEKSLLFWFDSRYTMHHLN